MPVWFHLILRDLVIGRERTDRAHRSCGTRMQSMASQCVGEVLPVVLMLVRGKYGCLAPKPFAGNVRLTGDGEKPEPVFGAAGSAILCCLLGTCCLHRLAWPMDFAGQAGPECGGYCFLAVPTSTVPGAVLRM